MIEPHLVRIAEHIIDSSGVVDILRDGRCRNRRGRPGLRNDYRLYLIGGLLNVLTRGNCVIGDIHRTLTKRISTDDQVRLGVYRRNPFGIERLVLTRLYSVSDSLALHLNYGEDSAPDIDDDERARRREVIRRYSDALMDVFPIGTSRSLAIDATGLWSWGKGAHGKNPDDIDQD